MFAVAFKYIKDFVSKYWYIFLITLLIVTIGIYVGVLRYRIGRLERQNSRLSEEIVEYRFMVSSMKESESHYKKEIAFRDSLIEVLKEMKKEEVIREKHYHTQIENNKTIAEKYEETNDLLPVFCQIDLYFGITSDMCE